MSPPSNVSAPGSAASHSGERIDLSHEQAPNTEHRERDTKADASTAHIIIDSDDDVDVAESSTAPMANRVVEQAQIPSHSGEAAGRDAPIIRELPYRTALPTEGSSRNTAGAAGSTYDTAIDITSSPPVPSRADRAPYSPASLSRKVSQRSSYIGDDYPAPSRDPPAGAAISDVDMPRAQWLGGSPSGSYTSGRRSSRDTPEEPATHSGYSFPDLVPYYDGPNSGYSSHQRPASRRRPSSMINTHHSRALVDDLENMIYGRSPTSSRGFQSGGSPRFDSDMSRSARRQSSDMFYPQARNRSFSARHSGESINAIRPPGHQRYSSVSMPRWQPGDEGPSRNRRARGSLSSSNEAPRNTTLDDIFQEVTLPRWQPDAEVSSCPICGTIFSFWHRKHHCRKCGRVVCAACSPHRITIPRQYIVRPPEPTDAPLPPGSRSSPSSNVVDLTGDDTATSRSILNPALGGGEEVRLCNPCVPDPNPNPLGYEAQRPHGHRSTHSLSSTMGNIWTVSCHHSLYISICSSLTPFLARQPKLTTGQADCWCK